MSSYLEPSFLLELGAYAVAAAGIRIFKSRYWRTEAQPSADGTSNIEQPVANVQATPPTVLGLGQASPLKVPTSPRCSSSPAPQRDPQLGTFVATSPLHEEDLAANPFPTRYCPSPAKQADGAGAPGSATGFDIGEAGPNSDGDHATADMADIGVWASTDGGNSAATGHWCCRAAQAAELTTAAPAASAAQEATNRANETSERQKRVVAAAAEAQRQRLRRASQRAEQRAAALADHATRQRARRASPTAEQRAAALAAHAARQRTPRGDGRCGLVSEPPLTVEAPAEFTGMPSEPCTTPASEDDNQPADETLATTSEGGPTFKAVLIGDGGTTKVCGANAVARAQRSQTNPNTGAEPAEDSNQDKAEAAQQLQEEANREDVNAMRESSDEEEGICGGISKDSSPRGFDLHVTHPMVPSSSTGVQRDSSAAGLVMDGSESDGELQPAAEAVVTHRDILLRAAQRRKQVVTDSDCFMSDTGLTFVIDSRKKPCGRPAAGHAQAGGTQVMPPSSLDTSLVPGANKVSHELLGELPMASASLHVRQPTLLGGDVTPPWVSQNLSIGPDSTPASSDCQPQPQEEREDQHPVTSRAMAPRPEAFLPVAGSVFDEAPGPETAAAFDAAPVPMDAVMFDDSQIIHAEEEEQHRHAPVESLEVDSECEEQQGHSQLQEPDQAKTDQIAQPTASSPAAVGVSEHEKQVNVLVALHDYTSPKPAAEEEELYHKQLSAATEPELDPVTEPAAEAASGRNRLYQDGGRHWRLRAVSWQPLHSHKLEYLSSGYHNSPHAEPSADADHPAERDPADFGEHEHMYRSGRLPQDQCTWESLDDAKHDSSGHQAQADRPQEEVWVLPSVDSAPPVTPDSPHRSSAPPNSPSWGLSDDPWGSPAPDSRPQSAWDSPPVAAPTSPALGCAGPRSSLSQRHMAPGAMSSSPAPKARSPFEALWHTPPQSQASTPMHESTPPSEGDPYGGDVVRGLDGDYAYGSYAYPPPPPTPTSPSPPPSSPVHQSGTLRYEDFHGGKSWRPTALASRLPALGSLDPFPASCESPPHLEEPDRAAPDSPALVAPDDFRQQGEEEQHDQEAAVAPTPLAYNCDSMDISSKRPFKTCERQGGEADPEGMGTGQGEASPLPSRLPSPLGRGGEGQPGVQGAGSAEPMSPPHPPHPYLPNTQAEGGFLGGADCGHISQVTGELESPSLEGAAAASSPKPVPDIQQLGKEEEVAAEPTAVRQGSAQGRAASCSPHPSPEHPLESSPEPSSESAFGESPRCSPSKIKGATGRHSDHDTGFPPSCPSRRESLEQPVPKAVKLYGHCEGMSKRAYTTPASPDNQEQAEGPHNNPSGAKAGGAADKGLQAEEQEQIDGPAGGQSHEQNRPVAASGPQTEEPEMMVEDDEEEECYEDDEVQFVSETGPDPSRSAFASAVKRLAVEEEDIELLPGIQDLISGASGSKQARHSRRSVVDVEDDIGNIDRSRGSNRRKRGCPTSPEARRSSPSQHGRNCFGRRHGQLSRSHDRHQLFCEGDEDVSTRRPASVCTATVSTAAGSRGAAAAATALGGHARRLRDMLNVAEEEDEEDDMDADMTCWRRLLKKSRHH